MEVSVALASMRFLQAWLIGVTPNDLASCAGSGAILMAAGILLMLFPVHRALSIDTLKAIHCD
jgi:hypothetical protein